MPPMFHWVLNLTLVALVTGLVAACAPAAPTAAPPATKPPAAAATTAPAPTSVGVSTTPKPAASPTAAAAAAPKIKRGGHLIGARAWTYGDFDPQRSASSGPVNALIYDRLLEINPSDPKTGKPHELEGMLAESWKVVDPKTVEFKLRKGVKFHDGSDWNAEVAKWNLDRLLFDKKSYNREVYANINSIAIIDPYTIQIKLKEPWGTLLLNLTSLQTSTLFGSKQAVEKGGDDILSTKPVGTGPFVIDQWVRDNKVVLKRFDNYWKMGADGKPLPYIDNYTERFIQDTSITLVELKAGTVHTAEDMEAKDIASIKANPDLVYWELPWVSALYFTYGVNTNAAPFQDNLKLRYALQYALDRDNMAKAMGFGMAKPAYYWAWAPATLGYDEKIVKYPFDLNKAKQSLAEAGYPNGLDISLLVVSRQPEQRIGEMVKQMWDTAGIRTTLDVAERLAANERAKAGNFDVFFFRHRNYPDPEMSLRLATCGVGSNYTGYCNQELQKCIAEAKTKFDNKDREQVYKKCLTIVQEDAAVGGGYFIPQNRVHAKFVKDLKVKWETSDYREVWLDK